MSEERGGGEIEMRNETDRARSLACSSAPERNLKRTVREGLEGRKLSAAEPLAGENKRQSTFSLKYKIGSAELPVISRKIVMEFSGGRSRPEPISGDALPFQGVSRLNPLGNVSRSAEGGLSVRPRACTVIAQRIKI